MALPDTIFATHEPDHRYFVSGYVRDESGNPREKVSVSLEHKGGEKQKATTDRRGYYETLFHLHNENLGDEIIVKVGEEVKKVTVAFDPGDHFSERRGTVDFGAPGKPSSDWMYWTGGVTLLIGVVVYFGLFRKKRKTKQPAARKKKR